MFGFNGLKDKSEALPRKPRDRTLKMTSLHLAPPRDAGRRKGTIRTKEESRIFSGCPPRGDFLAVQIPVDSHPEVGICAFPEPPLDFGLKEMEVAGIEKRGPEGGRLEDGAGRTGGSVSGPFRKECTMARENWIDMPGRIGIHYLFPVVSGFYRRKEHKR